MNRIQINQEMQEFSIEKETLVEIVSACQKRTFCQEVNMLEQKGQKINWIINGLASNQKNGISSTQSSIANRKEKYGTNEKYVKQLPGFCQLFIGALEDFILRILIVASIFSIAIEVGTATPQKRSMAWIEGVAVMAAVMICATVSAVNDYQKQRQFQQLNSVADKRKTVTIRRNGQTLEVHQDFVLVGDIVQLNEGMEIPADGILIQSNQISTDQSAMTGQTDPVHKNILQCCIRKKEEIEKNGEKNTAGKHEVPSPIIMSGTRMLTGQGKMIVLVVGDLSCLGKIRALLSQEEADATPLQKKLETIAEDIGKFGLYSSIAIVVILLIRFSIEKGLSKNWNSSKDIPELLNYFIIGITVIVVAIPQGLPLAVTLSLAFSVKKMLNDNNLVRKMEACETMGGANNICSDKTGTLTLNKMTLTTFWNGQLNEIDTYKQQGTLKEYIPDQTFAEMFTISCCVNSTANLRPEVKGSSTEVAILNFMQKMGLKYEAYRARYQTKLKYPFSSSRKRMSVIIQKDNINILLVKGASEMVLSCCNEWYNMKTGEVQRIDQKIQSKMKKSINDMAQKSLRTLCLAYKKLRASDNLETKDDKGIFDIEKHDLIVIALLGVKDIPREEVPEAIKKCNRAGIKVRMVTGDNIVTAKAIALDVGILKPGDGSLVMEGEQFIKKIGGVVCKKCQTEICKCAKDSKQSEETGQPVRVDTIKNGAQFDKLMPTLSVLARSRPQDKYALVTGLKQRGAVVAVTGDGTNDAPALKKADVGFAMGINGTQVARQSAAIILLDDNFNSIVRAVMWGRNIYDAIKKFIQFQLTVNVVAVVITLVGASIIKQQVLKPIQMLWINLIMDTLASLALATQPPTQQLLDRPPHSRDEYIISKTMFKHIIGQAIYQLIVIITLLFSAQLYIPQYPDKLDSSTFAGHPEFKYYNGIVGGTIRSGRMKFPNGSTDYQPIFTQTNIYSRHFTFIFNTFVMMQIFNFLCARKLHQQFNIFEGISRNIMFVVIVITIFILQIILISFGGIAFGVYANYGLTIQQWLISIAIGSGSIFVNLLLKLIPLSATPLQFGNKETDIKIKKKTLSLKRIEARVSRDLAKNIHI